MQRVVGFHGTTVPAAIKILESGFKMGERDWDWLGAGIYFWQDAPHRAIEWAQLRATGKIGGKAVQDSSVAIVEADLALEGCLDLLDNDWNEVIRSSTGEFLKQLTPTQRNDFKNMQPRGCNRLDCAFFNYFVASWQDSRPDEPIRSVRAAVAEGNPILTDSPIRYESHVQIAIRDLSLIGKPRITYLEQL